MKIIHTSDWHLGQFFYSKSRAAEHQAFLDWLLDQVNNLAIDAIIVAGDIFDTGSPPSYAREMLNRFIVALQPSGCQLILLAGNHDSVATLNESRDLVACLNTTLIAKAESGNEPQVLVVNDRQGQPGAILCAIPFLRPRDLQRSQAELSGQQKHQDLLKAISDYYHASFRQAQTLTEQPELSQLPIIATGHLTALGVTKTDSVREIYIGSLEAFPAYAFPPADYIALGHIHRAQSVGGQEHIRYSGSPIPLSFDELSQPKTVTLLTVQPGQPLAITALEIPCFQPMKTLKGSLDQIAEQLASLAPVRQTPPLWLDIEVHQQEYLTDLQPRIEQLTQGLAVEVLLLRRKRQQQSPGIERQHNEVLHELSVEEVFCRRLDCEDLSEQSRQQLLQLFKQTLVQLADEPRD